MPETFPSDWRSQPCILASIPAPLVPYIAGLTKILEKRGFWASDSDYENAYAALFEFGRCLAVTCLDDLIESNNRLYRMLDTALYGKEYTVESTDPLVVTPGIPAAHELIFQPEFGLMMQVDKLMQMLDNRIAGTETPLYADTPGLKQQLQTIIDNMAGDDTDIATIISDLELLLALLA